MASPAIKKTLSFLGLTLGTAAMGVLAGVILGAILTVTLGSRLEGWDAIAILGVGIIFGYPLGIILGQLIALKWRRYHGSLVLGAAGAILGAALTFGLAYLLYPGFSVEMSMLAYFLLTPLAGAAGYHLKPKSKRAATGV